MYEKTNWIPILYRLRKEIDQLSNEWDRCDLDTRHPNGEILLVKNWTPEYAALWSRYVRLLVQIEQLVKEDE